MIESTPPPSKLRLKLKADNREERGGDNFYLPHAKHLMVALVFFFIFFRLVIKNVPNLKKEKKSNTSLYTLFFGEGGGTACPEGREVERENEKEIERVKERDREREIVGEIVGEIERMKERSKFSIEIV